MKKKLTTLLMLLLCVCSGAWATEETISLTSHTLTDGVVVLNSTSGNATLTSNMATNIKNNNYDSRGVRWQYTGRYIQVVVAEGHKINSITLTSGSNGNSVTSLTYTLTDGSSALSGSWDHAPNSGKQASYTWTASSGTYYRTWYLNKTNDTGDIYISSVSINYEEASVSNTAPSIVTQPASTLDAYVGFESTLSIAASGYPAPSYQWYSCTNTEKANSAAIDGATSSSYTFTPSATGTLYYYCVATNNYDDEDHTATSNVSTVTVGRKYSVEYSKGETGATISNTLPLTYYVDGTSITLPKNHYFYLAGSSVTKWNDGTNDHEFNSSHTVSSNVTFYPVFAANSKALGDEATTITWTFSRDAGAPVYAIEGDGKSCSVIGTTANGIDLKMDVTLSKSGSDVGKFNNTGYTNRAQVNKYTSFTIPAVSGMVVTYIGTSGAASTDDEVLFGEDKATSVDGSTYSYTYNGSAATLTITDNKSGMYPSGISVSYPYAPSIGSDVTFDLKNPSFVVSGDGTTQDGINFKSTGSPTASYLNFDNKDGGQTMTIAGSGSKRITKVVITYTASGNDRTGGGADMTVSPYDAGYTLSSATGTWESQYKSGEASVTFTTANKARMEKVVVTYVEVEAVSTLAGRNYGSYVTSSKLDFTNVTDAKAYVATGLNGGKDAVVLTQVYKVPANEPLIIYTTEKESSATVYVPKTLDSADDAVASNALVAGNGSTAWNGTAGYTYYYLASDLFHKATDGTLQSGKAYLKVAGDPTSARELSIVFEDGETTAISEVRGKKADVRGEYFDLQGRKVAQPTKGLYIVNGRKVVIR